ncbi:Cas9 inhibitor AcrIIA9 family protein [uncultured Clostridium sp.]|uniref:Cas9 inhibitor AcrIIA9 family protein n=1 Tax=uncultured Clostridium sp. TaxID=59620 RepID=UPI0026089B99|nr:Cas9 inhibitor AcrIIA9 family protein [uncultured Clostridium sp.]
MEEAIKKIKEEMEKNKRDLFVLQTGNHILLQIETNAVAAKEIVEGKKSIEGALKYLRNEAKKRAKTMDTCVIMTDAEGFGIINKYFGFEVIQHEFIELEEEEIKSKITQKQKEVKKEIKEIEFETDLEKYF